MAITNYLIKDFAIPTIATQVSNSLWSYSGLTHQPAASAEKEGKICENFLEKVKVEHALRLAGLGCVSLRFMAFKCMYEKFDRTQFWS